MASNQSTFIQLPMDVTNPIELRRFLDKIIQQLDIVFGNRGAGDIKLEGILVAINKHEIRLDNIENDLHWMSNDIQKLLAGDRLLVITENTILSYSAVSVLCDCSSTSIEVKLPDPDSSFNSGRSNTISISKIDPTKNKVNIVPFNTELIVTENNVDLLHQSEVINLITDGTNWYLGA